MRVSPSEIAFTEAVRAEQQRLGSREQYERAAWAATITPDLQQTLAEARSCYLATASASGQPYVQHRGGPPGFLKPLDENRIAFADYRGNKQYITTGNLSENPRAFLFLMDYARQRRTKIWGEARVIEGDDALLEKVMDPAYRAAPERVIVFTVAAWDRNCPQHIPRMLHIDDVAAAIRGFETRITELEAENARLRGAG
jgi:predicted pyridoxine 5'-phosphate oxidase superfamily flavin-nucleotide-binding protein